MRYGRRVFDVKDFLMIKRYKEGKMTSGVHVHNDLLDVLNAQDNRGVAFQDVKIGDIFEIGKLEMNTNKHIEFPKPNFIIKKRSIANQNRVEGNKVVVTDIQECKDSTNRIKIKRTDGSRFLGSHGIAMADFKKALQSLELQVL